MKIIFSAFLLCFAFVFTSPAQETLLRREWNVGGVTREALVHIPATSKTNSTPVIFAFHGHGGNMRNAARTFRYHTIWPEAIVVYMQGLNTPGRLTDPEGKKPGWQHGLGAQGDRDLNFYDTVLTSLKKEYKVNAKKIYATGHSNGGGFTYLLWEARGTDFAAFAPSAAVGRALVQNNPAFAEELKRRGIPGESAKSNTKSFIPKPVLHVAGENDELVKYAWQKMMIEALRKIQKCAAGKPWPAEPRCTIYSSEDNPPVVTYITKGTHKFPREAREIIVKFFKEHSQP